LIHTNLSRGTKLSIIEDIKSEAAQSILLSFMKATEASQCQIGNVEDGKLSKEQVIQRKLLRKAKRMLKNVV
jgi:hypothetical protein